jgi:hypothetical protein
MRRFGAHVVLAAAVAALLAGVWTTLAGGAVDLRNFSPQRFPPTPSITNQWLPTIPGTQFVYDGTSVTDRGRVVPHRIVSIVSDMTKLVDGVRVLVIWDRDYLNGTLSESELALWAQDTSGNVWLLGENPAEFGGGHRFLGAPDTWVSGASGAHAGVLMRAAPRTGTDSYVQGYAPAIQFKDMAQVFATGQSVCTPARCYSNALEIEEWNAYAPAEGHQLKYHAPGIGIVKIGSLDSSDQETMNLTSVTHLSATAMNGVRSSVLQLDRRAYQVSADWRTTSPAQPMGAAQPLTAAPVTTSRSRAAGPTTALRSSPSTALPKSPTVTSSRPTASPSTPTTRPATPMHAPSTTIASTPVSRPRHPSVAERAPRR